MRVWSCVSAVAVLWDKKKSVVSSLPSRSVCVCVCACVHAGVCVCELEDDHMIKPIKNIARIKDLSSIKNAY